MYHLMDFRRLGLKSFIQEKYFTLYEKMQNIVLMFSTKKGKKKQEENVNFELLDCSNSMPYHV